jgi:hypothetical protein
LTEHRIGPMLRRMRTSSRLVLIGVLALAMAAPALASTFTTGDYVGTTSQKNGEGRFRKIKLHADATAGQLSKIVFFSTGKCNDGSHSHGWQGKGENKLFADVDENGHFSLFAPSKSGATKLTMSGTIVGNKASGTFTIKSRFNKNTNKSDPNGSVKCSSGKVKWSAKTG